MSEQHHVAPATHVRGALHVPGDKSASHRALLISALANGESTIEGLSTGADVASTARIVRQLGATFATGAELVTVAGPANGLHAASSQLDCGNSGTTMRLLCGLVSTIEGDHLLVGDASLSQRPMDRVALPLSMMGSVVVGEGPLVCAPLRVTGASPLRAIEYRVPVASAQVKSAILLAGLGADGATTVIESVRTRTTTEDMLRHAGLDVRSADEEEGRRVTVTPGRPAVRHWVVPGDPSQAAFFAVLGAVHPDAGLEVVAIDASRERIGFAAVLERMGAAISLVGTGSTRSLVVKSSDLVATEVVAAEIPSVDEVPVLTVAAAAASGVSAFRAMGELRLKESDRFAGSMALAAALGCRVWSEGDDFFVEGLGSATKFRPFEFEAGLDHRMVMASAVAGCAGAGCSIGGASTVSSSYPHFFRDLESLQ